MEVGALDGFGELCASGLHAGGVETTAHLELEGTFGTGLEEFGASCVDGLNLARNHELAGAVVVGAHDCAVNTCTDFLDFLVGKGEHGSHCGGVDFACFLHSLCTGRHEAETVLKAECSGSYES